MVQSSLPLTTARSVNSFTAFSVTPGRPFGALGRVCRFTGADSETAEMIAKLSPPAALRGGEYGRFFCYGIGRELENRSGVTAIRTMRSQYGYP